MPNYTSARFITILLTITFGFLLFYFTAPFHTTSISSVHASKEYASSDQQPFVAVSMQNPNINPPPEAWKNSTRANAVLVFLCRNSDLNDVRWTMRQMEARFNSKFNYPYVFLNDDPFSEEFKELTRSMTKAKTEFGVIPHEHWSYPPWIDVEKADAARQKMEADGIIYGGSLPYRHMCRFNSGFFYRHPLLEKYDYYWRIEPSVEFYCDIDYDPFLYMQENGKKYGWTITLYEYESTIMTLWSAVKEFMEEYPDYLPRDNLLPFISGDNGTTYNLCHFWSNFEIGDLNWLRGPVYTRFFEHLDRKGGFFYERWGDAPVHSIAAALFLRRSEVHFFEDIGYRHPPFMHCPTNKDLNRKCHCNSEESFDWSYYSCMQRWVDVISAPVGALIAQGERKHP